MSFLRIVEQARAFLQRNGRVSLSALKLEFDLDDTRLESLIEELVDVQQIAARQGKVLSWIDASSTEGSAPEPETRATPEASSEPVGARQPVEAERRQLTVMFCDLVGSTDLSQRLDAEDLRNVVRAYQESASAVIERFEGHIAQYLGDGLLVYFGYPLAHEDDAERAIRAGREILAALARLNDTLEPEHGIRLAARVGIHTGPVVVGEMGGGAKSETLALGETTNIAARLENVAAPGSVVTSAATLRLVPGVFVTKDLGTPALKGIAAAVRAYAVLGGTGVRSRLDLAPSSLTPLVGRDQELGLLLERWEQVEDGEGQTVLLSGEAGLGKSRLLHEFRERLAETPHGWIECRCSPYTEGSAFHPVVEMIERGGGFADEDDSETRLARLEAGVTFAGLSAPDAVPLLARLLSLPLPDRYAPLRFSPELQRKKTIEALADWILGLASSQPVVMLVEDLHWCDASTLEFLAWLLEQSPTAKVLTLLSFRPGFVPPWPARSHITPLAVKRLSRRQATNLIGGMTRDVPLPEALVERLVERADGVPLFVEELTKMVLETDLVREREGRYELTGPVTELAIPATLQDSLMARLDRLDEAKDVAQLGAALGREFSYELLRAVSVAEEPRLRVGLAQLVDAELFYQRGALPKAEFIFKHALIQETAYQSLLRSVRRKLHARIARVLEDEFPARVEAEPEVIARHYDEAGLAEEAIAHYARAGERETERSASEEAISHLRRALELVAMLPESPARSRQELSLRLASLAPLLAARGMGNPECAEAHDSARELALQLGEARELPQLLAGLASSHWVSGDMATAGEVVQQALAAAERTRDAGDLLMAHQVAGCQLYSSGEPSRAVAHLKRTIEFYDPREHAARVGIDQGVHARAIAAVCHCLLGQPDQGRVLREGAVALAKQVENPHATATALGWAAMCSSLVRELDRTREYAEAAQSLSEQLGFPVFVVLGKFLRGWVRAHARDGAQGVVEMEEAIAGLAETGTAVQGPWVLANLAEGFWKVGRRDDALGALSAGLARADEHAEHFFDAELQRLRGEILVDRDAAESEAVFHQALEIARRQRANLLELRAATSLARLWHHQGKRGEAGDLLTPVYESFTEGFDTQDLKDAKVLLEELT